MMKTTIASLGLIIFAACSKNIPFPATYVEKHNENVASSESERYIFKTANDFEYIFFTDAINYSKYGHGKYYVKNRKLILEFSNQPFDTLRSKIESRPILSIDSSRIRYKIRVQSHSGEDLELINVRLLHVKNKKIEASTFTDSSGYAEISLVRSRIPVTLRAINLGYDYLTYEITTDQSQYFTIKLAEKNFGSQIKDERWKKRIKINGSKIVIEGTTFVEETAANTMQPRGGPRQPG